MLQEFDSVDVLIQHKNEESISTLIERKKEVPKQPNYMKEKNISFYIPTAFSSIIVICAIISIISNIKRKIYYL